MVKFKEGRTWTAKLKHNLVKKVISQLNDFSAKDLFRLLEDDFKGISAYAIASEYYWLLKEEPEAVKSLIEEMKNNNEVVVDPYTTTKYKKMFPDNDSDVHKDVNIEVKAIVAEEEPKNTIAEEPASEDKILLSLSKLLNGLSLLKDFDNMAFIDGLTSIVSRATDPESSPILKQKESVIISLNSEIDKLTKKVQDLENRCEEFHKANRTLFERNNKLTDDLEYVSDVINEFAELNSAGKLAHMNKITHDLKITVDKYGMVLKTERKNDNKGDTNQ